MYDLIDRPVRELNAFERDFLLAMRRWTHALTATGRTSRQAPLGRAMCILHEASQETFVIQPPCGQSVDDDEAMLLNLCRLVRDKAHQQATSIARHLVGEQASDMIDAIDFAVQHA